MAPFRIHPATSRGSQARANNAIALRHRQSTLDKRHGSEDTPPASPDLLLPVATALADIPALALTESEASGLRHGQAISLVTLMGCIPGTAEPDGGLVWAVAGARVIGVARLEHGWMKPERLL